ncbi:MAG: hypothetical protein EOP62_14270 [Sphingomonadales bacterium]|nr:MAG: hypothetical protein EOP62_14270 [Sphingomonadales bacterium]
MRAAGGGWTGAPISVAAWAVQMLGPLLNGYWDAAAADTLDLSGDTVTAWRDQVSGLVLTGIGSPAFANSGGVPRIELDGIGDGFELPNPPFPIGNAPSETWALVRQDAIAGDDASVRTAIGYGGPGTGRRIDRAVNGGVNSTWGVSASTVAANLSTDMSGLHLLRLAVSANAVSIGVDRDAVVSKATMPATAGTRLRVGANPGPDTPNQFWHGAIIAVLNTQPLSPYHVTRMRQFADLRMGLA